MSREKTIRNTLSVGQLARRWSIGVDRARRMIDHGQLRGAFKLPSAGRYGEAIRIPLASVLAAEQEWLLASQASVTPTPLRTRRSPNGPTLKHFPELACENPLPAPECHEDETR